MQRELDHRARGFRVRTAGSTSVRPLPAMLAMVLAALGFLLLIEGIVPGAIISFLLAGILGPGNHYLRGRASAPPGPER